MKNKYKKFAYTVQQLELNTGGGDSMIGLCLQSITVGRHSLQQIKHFFSSDFPKLGPVLKKIIKLLLHFNLNKALETFGDKKDQNKKNLTNKTRQNKTKPNHYNSKHECKSHTHQYLSKTKHSNIFSSFLFCFVFFLLPAGVCCSLHKNGGFSCIM